MNTWVQSTTGNQANTSGDFARFVDLGPQKRAVVAGTVAGRGVGAVDAATTLCTNLHRILARGVAPGVALDIAQGIFSHALATEMTPFASVFIAVADLREGLLHYASAGRVPGFLFDGDAHWHLDRTGPALGVENATAYEERTYPMFDDSLLVAVTDVIVEARPPGSNRFNFFGTAGVARAVGEALRRRRNPANEIYSAAIRHAGRALGEGAQVVAFCGSPAILAPYTASS